MAVLCFFGDFTFPVLLQLCGLLIFGVGVWAWNEKEIFNNFNKLTNVALDPAFVLIILGGVAFIIGITGSLGALRESTCLLAAYSMFLVLLLLFEMSFGVLVFILKDKGLIKEQATNGLRAFIVHYREDADQQNLIDWIQEDWLQCCGIDSIADWESNQYCKLSPVM